MVVDGDGDGDSDGDVIAPVDASAHQPPTPTLPPLRGEREPWMLGVPRLPRG